MEIVKFVSEKIKGYSFLLLIRLEFESLAFGLASLIPTALGLFIRGGFAKIFFGSCRGFCWIQPRVVLIHTERLRIGKSMGINSGSYINAIGGIEVGDYVLIGSNVTISSGMHPIEGPTPAVFARQTIPRKIIIEDDVWIGAGAVIMPGIRLAKGSVIGANSVVTRDTKEYSVNLGAPARFVRSRLDPARP